MELDEREREIWSLQHATARRARWEDRDGVKNCSLISFLYKNMVFHF